MSKLTFILWDFSQEANDVSSNLADIPAFVLSMQVPGSLELELSKLQTKSGFPQSEKSLQHFSFTSPASTSGTPFALTIDFDSLTNNDATIRDRNTEKQIRVKITDLRKVLHHLINGELGFDKAGKPITKKDKSF